MNDDLIGKRFGRLEVISKLEPRSKFLCKCDCGNFHYVSRGCLLSGNVKSCGCLGLETKRNNGNFGCVDGTKLQLLTQKVRTTNTSGVKGVVWNTRKHKWRAKITFKKKDYHLGYFGSVEDAAKVRKMAEQELFEPFLSEHSHILYNGGDSNGG